MKRYIPFVFVLFAMAAAVFGEDYVSEYYFTDGFTLSFDEPYAISADATNENHIEIVGPDDNRFSGVVWYVEDDLSSGMYDTRTMGLVAARSIADWVSGLEDEEHITIVSSYGSNVPGFFVDLAAGEHAYYSMFITDLTGTPGGQALLLIIYAFDTEDVPVAAIDDLVEHMYLEFEDAAG